MSEFLKSFLSRKFILAVLVAVLGTLFIGEVDGDSKLKFLEWLFGLYATANVAQKATAQMPDEPEVEGN